MTNKPNGLGTKEQRYSNFPFCIKQQKFKIRATFKFTSVHSQV